MDSTTGRTLLFASGNLLQLLLGREMVGLHLQNPFKCGPSLVDLIFVEKNDTFVEGLLEFSVRFGLTFVNYTTGVRTPKMSARWFQKHVTPLNGLPTDGQPLPVCDRALLEDSVVVV